MYRKETAACINYYHELAANHWSEIQAQLTQAVETHNLLINGRGVLNVLRPYFIDQPTYDYIVRISTLFITALKELVGNISQHRALCEKLGIRAAELFFLQKLPTHPSLIGRLDGFLTPTGNFQVIEYNANPGAFTFNDAINQTFTSLPFMQTLRAKYPFRTVSNFELTFESLMQQTQRNQLPTIGIIEGRQTRNLTQLVLQDINFTINYLEQSGCRILRAPINQVDYRNGELLIEGVALDQVFVLDWESLSSSMLQPHLFDTLHRGRTRLIQNPWDYYTCGRKTLFAILSDPQYAYLLKPEVMAQLSAHIPWTRILSEGKTSYQGNTIDLIPFITAQREQFVIKPSEGLGGQGVILGWECDAQQWQREIKKALQDTYVVQERVTMGEETFPVMVEGEVKFENYYFDLNPFVWYGKKVEGSLMRLAQTSILNVSAGSGSMTPMFILTT